MFARYNRRKASIGDYDTIFRNLLEQRKKIHPELFTTVVFMGYFVLRRIYSHEATTDADNNNVDTAAIELINRWRKRESERG